MIKKSLSADQASKRPARPVFDSEVQTRGAGGQNPFKLIIAILLFGSVYFLGYLHGHGNLVYQNGLTPKYVKQSLGQPESVNFSLFWDTYNKIQSDSLNKLDQQKALEGSLKGLVSSLDDPFSVYLTKDESTQFYDDLNNKFEGIGAELTMKDGVLSVISPLKDSPAQKSGLKPRDQILSIDGKDVKLIDLTSAVGMIRGKQGTTVSLVVLTPGDKESRNIKITRQSIQAESVTKETVDNNIALIRINQFSEDTSKLTKRIANDLSAHKPNGIILDLRNNPGGLLDSSVDVASLFLDKGTVLIEQDKNGKKKEKPTSQDAILKDIPMVVLINDGSASASEIVAGAIKDRERGKILGQKSYGKGTVQDLIELKDGSTLRLTIAQWLTPNGTTINHEGIKPDIEGEDDLKTDNDELVDKAVSVLNQK